MNLLPRQSLCHNKPLRALAKQLILQAAVQQKERSQPLLQTRKECMLSKHLCKKRQSLQIQQTRLRQLASYGMCAVSRVSAHYTFDKSKVMA